jgi:UDP-N-acetylglucosamine 2-epimerase (non-hydrolysing)
MKSILISFGTRPEYIKLLPIMKELDRREVFYKILFTGQHKDMKFGHVDYLISIPDRFFRLHSIVSDILEQTTYIIDKFDTVIVQGDTSSAFAIALSAFYLKKEVVHIEAGIRTDSRYEPFPEEINRRLISQLATYHFCPTQEDAYNLQEFENVFVVGNTVLDNLVDIKPEYIRDRVLILLHRRDNEDVIPEYMKTIDSWAGKHLGITFVAIKFPNPAMNKGLSQLDNIFVEEPFEYEDFTRLLAKAKFVITDSGGILDEAMFLGKKVIVPRKLSSSRFKFVDSYIYPCADSEELVKRIEEVNNNYKIEPCFYFGKGDSSKKIVETLL